MQKERKQEVASKIYANDKDEYNQSSNKHDNEVTYPRNDEGTNPSENGKRDTPASSSGPNRQD